MGGLLAPSVLPAAAKRKSGSTIDLQIRKDFRLEVESHIEIAGITVENDHLRMSPVMIIGFAKQIEI